MYGDHLEILFKHFARENIHIMLYEDIKHDADRTLEQLYSFIGVDSTYRYTNFNAVAKKSFQSRPYLAWLNNGLFKIRNYALSTPRLFWLVKVIKTYKLNYPIKKILKLNASRKIDNEQMNPTLSAQTIQRLTAQYASDFKKIDSLLHSNVSSVWHIK